MTSGWLSQCPDFIFFVVVIKFPEKRQLRVEGCVSAHSSSLQSTIAGKSRLELQDAGYNTSSVKTQNSGCCMFHVQLTFSHGPGSHPRV